MSQIKKHVKSANTANDTSVSSVNHLKIFPSFPSHQSVKQFLKKYPSAWNDFLQFPPETRQKLLDFCIGKNGLRITYDPVFRKIFSPELHKVYCIILMEQSPLEFHSVKDKYIHVRTASFDTGIYKNNAGLHEDVFICLDTFHSIVHNITKSSTLQDAWLTFLDSEDISEISELVRNFPMFLPIYKEIAEFAQRPEELINMFSEALYIMDRNMERLMVEEMREKLEKTIASSQAELEAARDMAKIEIDAAKEEVNAIMAEVDAVKAKVESAKAELESARTEAESARTEAESARTEAEIFRQRLAGSSPEEIADSLSITLDKVNNVLSSVNK